MEPNVISPVKKIFHDQRMLTKAVQTP